MSEGKAFKHISVVAEPEEDMVIEAGMVEHAVSAAGESEPEAVRPAAPGQMPAEIVPGQKLVDDSPTAGGMPVDAERAARGRTAGTTAAKRQAADDGYRDPTLDDLEGAPMPLAQKVVIVAAIVLIAMAIVYCTLFMG